ncbi:hypothetical protein D3C78_1815480 [compost metagenome]
MTMANSAATKKPLSKTRIRAKRIMPKSAKIVARVKPGEGSMMEFCGFRVFEREENPRLKGRRKSANVAADRPVA